MQMNEDTIQYLEGLTKLKLSQEERKKMKEELSAVLNYMECVSNTEKDFSFIKKKGMETILRDDIIVKSSDRKELLMNAPDCENGNIIIPKTV